MFVHECVYVCACADACVETTWKEKGVLKNSDKKFIWNTVTKHVLHMDT